MKEIIKQLKEEKNKLDLKIIRLNRIISDLEELILDKLEKEIPKKVPKTPYRAEVVTKQRKSKYPNEMKGFIEKHMNQNSNQKLCDMINEKWDVEITVAKLAAFISHNKLKREIKVKKNLDGQNTGKKKENNPYNLIVNGEKVPEEIMKYVEGNVYANDLTLRDEIIELYEINYNPSIIKMMQNQFKEKENILSSGE